VEEKIRDIFKHELSEEEINEFATLVYYPEEKLQLIRDQFDNNQELNEWYTNTIDQMIRLIPYASSKYTRSKLRKVLPKQFVYIIEELLYKTDEYTIKHYYSKIVQKVISLGQADKLIIVLAYTTQQLVVDHLHVVGDIYDRWPEPDKIMGALINYHSLDIQWGNHDVLYFTITVHVILFINYFTFSINMIF